MNHEPWICADCGTAESDEQYESNQDCRCGGRFAPRPYEFKEKPAAKSSSNTLINVPGKIACPTCGCRDIPKKDCNCYCHCEWL